MRLWVKSARKHFAKGQSTRFNMMCKLYYYIRTVLSDKEPCDIKMKYDELRSCEGVKALGSRKRSREGIESRRRKRPAVASGDDAGAGSGAEGGGVEDDTGEVVPVPEGELLKGEWYDLAVTVSLRFVGTGV